MALNSNSAIIVPPAPPEQAAQDIRGIKPPLEIAEGWAWLWWTAGILLLLAAAWIAYRRLKGKAAAPEILPVTPPHVIAKHRLQQALSRLSDPKAFCTEVSDTIRVYLEDRFHFHAPERTTEEFLLELRGTDRLLPDQKDSLGDFLQVCDLVKFARHEPDESALRDLHEAACRLVDETQFDSVQAPPDPAPPALPAAVAAPAGPRKPTETAPRP